MQKYMDSYVCGIKTRSDRSQEGVPESDKNSFRLPNLPLVDHRGNYGHPMFAAFQRLQVSNKRLYFAENCKTFVIIQLKSRHHLLNISRLIE